MEQLTQQLQAFWKAHATSIKLYGGMGAKAMFVCFVSYLISSTVGVVGAGLVAGNVLKQSHNPGKGLVVNRPNLTRDVNATSVRLAVLDRNIFNSKGETPTEVETGKNEARPAQSFDPNADCQPSSLSLELMGAIVSGAPEYSVVSLKEKGFATADHYRIGEAIIGNQQAIIHAVEPGLVVINNDGVKECLEIKQSKYFQSIVTKEGPNVGANQGEQNSSPDIDADRNRSVRLEISYVERELGPGFVKILESGRLVPFEIEGAMKGFKLVGVKSESLWRKVGLSSGDVLTSVNGISMAEPDKGFSIFESLQNDKEIRVEYLEKGETPSVVTIAIQ